MTEPNDSSLPPDQQAVLEAVNALLAPLARLAVARGVPFSEVDERLKTAFVQAARDANPGGLPHRQVSRISTATGINRREVTRLVHAKLEQARPKRSLAGEVYAHWLTDPLYRDVAGQPKPLPRQGPRPSFEALAREVTSDVHPRSLLSEMQRLGYATLDEAADQVLPVKDALVPRSDLPRALRILGSNVGSHLAGAVANVLGDGRQHFEQAIVASGVPLDAVQAVRQLTAAQWKQAFDSLVPALERLIEAGAAEPVDGAAPSPTQRVLIGLYSYHQPDAPPPQGEALPPAGDKS
ncbi:DUF6502 family protein [Ideonella sp.]|uniref:DUF6502 family protein n=1 Tax=Ideonella sp. TaxID=1929293 RepID=UPI002B495F3C|nr:DUF6502 family protein [Ideonella sp.]HJV68634.1 DUF6502 family protein [Ideonella sp.]